MIILEKKVARHRVAPNDYSERSVEMPGLNRGPYMNLYIVYTRR